MLVWLSVWSKARHMVKLMPLPFAVSCFSKIQIGFTFWHLLTRVVPDKGPLNGCVYVGTIIEQMDHKKYTRRREGASPAVPPTLPIISNCNLQPSRALPRLKSTGLDVDQCLSLHGAQKHWWSPELDELKQQCIDATV